MIAVTGARSTIIQELRALLPDEDFLRHDLRAGRSQPLPVAERWVLAAGLIHSKSIIHQRRKEMHESLSINLIHTLRICECVLTRDDDVRICVIGSESGFSGSFDEVYAAAKAGVHNYVANRKLKPTQLLSCVAPPIIADSAMTRARHDYPAVLDERKTVTARDVAIAVRRHLFEAPLGQSFVERLC